VRGLHRVGSVPIVRNDGLREMLRLSYIVEVSHLRKAAVAWLSEVGNTGQSAPLFNWVAVFNFNAHSDGVLFSLHNGA